MKNLKRRLLSFALVLILILSTAAVLSGCYVTHSATMKYVEGTYELTNYNGDSDWLTERGMKLIMVIKSDGTGYYGYRDDTTAPFISELRCKFETDPEDSKKYQYLSIDFEGNGEYHRLAINARLRYQNLNSQEAKWKGNIFEGNAQIDYYIDVDFTRISKATDMSVIQNEFGAVPFFPLGAREVTATYGAHYLTSDMNTTVIQETPFVYLYIDIDMYTGGGKVWYMLKSDERAVEDQFHVSATSDGNGSYTLALDSVEIKFNRGWPSGIYLIIPYSSELGDLEICLSPLGRYTEDEVLTKIDGEYSAYLANKDVSE